jgi:uncharacterized protein (DUF2336 family)
VSASDFRQIAIKGEARKAERLFRAAVSAFCSLTRPSRREIAQLEDLALPLFDMVSVESRRYVAAALSECESAPKALVDRLCAEPVEIAAPLLVRSKALTDIDLIAIIGRHGLPHARAIARRPGLNQTIAHLIRALERRAPANLAPAPEPAGKTTIADDEVLANPGDAADNARRRLRSMMLPARSDGDQDAAEDSRYAKLSAAALTGNPAFFQAALANALDMDTAAARSITETSSHSALLAALRALDLAEERAFLIAAAVLPGHFAHAEAIRLFLERYRALDRDTALDRVRNWRVEAAALSVRRNAQPPLADNAAPPADRFRPRQPG